MLSQLLQLVQASRSPCRIEELSRVLGAQPSAVEGMLETLVRRGRVVAIENSPLACDDCALSGKCDLPRIQGRRYASIHGGPPVPASAVPCMLESNLV